MTRAAQQVLSDALGLAQEDRAAIAGDLLQSLDPPDPAAHLSHEQWLAEVESRARAALAGREGLSWEEARAEIEARLSRR